jgi:hypothetical protein
MGSLFAFSTSRKCCKFTEFYYASAFIGEEWDIHGRQAPQFNFLIIKVH